MSNKGKLPKWGERTVTERILFIAQIMLTIVIVFLCILQIFSIWDKAINVFEPLLGVMMLVMFLQYRKYSKITSYTYLGLSIFIFLDELITVMSK